MREERPCCYPSWFVSNMHHSIYDDVHQPDVPLTRATVGLYRIPIPVCLGWPPLPPCIRASLKKPWQVDTSRWVQSCLTLPPSEIPHPITSCSDPISAAIPSVSGHQISGRTTELWYLFFVWGKGTPCETALLGFETVDFLANGLGGI